jgi:hypothetical protein
MAGESLPSLGPTKKEVQVPAVSDVRRVWFLIASFRAPLFLQLYRRIIAKFLHDKDFPEVQLLLLLLFLQLRIFHADSPMPFIKATALTSPICMYKFLFLFPQLPTSFF